MIGVRPSPKNIQATIARNKRGLSLATREKIRRTLTGVKFSPERLAKYLSSSKVKEWIQKTRERNRHGLSLESRAKITRAIAGRKWEEGRRNKFLKSEKVQANIKRTIARNKIGLSPESREKMIRALTGRKWTEKQRESSIKSEKYQAGIQRLIARNKIGLSPESRKKMADSLRGRKLKPETWDKIRSSAGWNRAQESLRSCNELRKRKVLCVDTGEVFDSIRSASKHTGKKEQQFRQNLIHGWKTSGKLYTILENK